jgi:hypothetical protein
MPILYVPPYVACCVAAGSRTITDVVSRGGSMRYAGRRQRILPKLQCWYPQEGIHSSCLDVLPTSALTPQGLLRTLEDILFASLA